MWIKASLVVLVLAAAGCSTGRASSEPDPDSPEGLTERATRAYLEGRTERAIDLCRQVLAEEPKSVRAHLVMGMAFRLAADRASGPEREALRREELAALAKAAELDPNNLAARIDLASSLQRAGEQKRAAEQLRRASELTPGAAWTKTVKPQAGPADPAAAPEAGAAPAAARPPADSDQSQEP